MILKNIYLCEKQKINEMLDESNQSIITKSNNLNKRKKYCYVESCKNFRGTENEIRMFRYLFDF